MAANVVNIVEIVTVCVPPTDVAVTIQLILSAAAIVAVFDVS